MAPPSISPLLLLISTGVAVYYITSHLISLLSPTPPQNKKLLKALQKQNPALRSISLTEHETALLGLLVLPEDISVTFKDVGGLDEIVDDLRELVIYPLTHPEVFPQHSLLAHPPKGVLLYGPPGCGKTMLAKALAKESGASFLNIRMLHVMDKWYGESNKTVDAIFSLARKIEPCIVFIDEIDSFLRKRESADHEVTSLVKAEFMMLWDGLVSSGRVLVLGATNRPGDIDEAFLRRMPKKFAVQKPGTAQRATILRMLLEGSDVEDLLDFTQLAELTEGYSGSDLKEWCRDAMMRVARESIRKSGPGGEVVLRPLKESDFFKASWDSVNKASSIS